MKHLCLAALLIPGLLSSPAPVSSEALGTVEYEVRYLLGGLDTKVADAAISLEHSTWEGQKVLHAHAVIRTAPIFRLFMNAEYLADTYLVSGGLEPLYYMNPIKRAGKLGRFECVYDKSAGIIRSEFVRPPADSVSKSFPLDGKTMDLLSLLQYVRFLDLAEGRSLSMHVLKAGLSVPATLTNKGPDTERYPGVETDRFLLTMTETGLMENGSGNKITVWRQAGSERVLLGMEVNLGSGVMLVTIKP